jgi:hypothetical protein
MSQRRLARALAALVLLGAGAASAADTQWLGPPPRFDPADLEVVHSVASAPAPEHHVLAVDTIPAIDTSMRAAVRTAYYHHYAPPMPDMAWTGSIESCNAGSISTAFQEWTITRVNFVRAMAGVPGTVTLNPTTSAKAQQAALMFAANRQLSHSPPSTWLCYSADGYEAAGKSNIALSFGSPSYNDVVALYMDDPGQNNPPVGHRRYILYPPQTTMGVGSTPTGPGQWGGNALWVVGDFGQRPPTPNGVAWPPRGFVPMALFPSSKRWSLSYPGANFSGSTVAMTADGASVPLTVVSRTDSYGDNTIVWEPALTVSRGAVYQVSIASVSGTGVPASFAYTVRAFDPADAIVARTDFDGDGSSDILWRHASSGHNALWRMAGTSLAASAFLTAAVPDERWRMIRTGDFDGDGKADILWRRAGTGEIAVWLMDGVRLAASAFLPAVPNPAWTVAGTGDFDGDGKIDLLWRNAATGDNVIWRMNGLTLARAAFITPVADTGWTIAATGDFDGDGRADLLWRNTSTGATAIWLMNGFTMTSNSSIGTVVPDWVIAGAADYDGDGRSDILWRHRTSGQNAIWLMDRFTSTESALLPGVPDASWTIVGTGDYDADARADILWRNTSTGETAVWLVDRFTVKGSAFLPAVPDQNWTIVQP